VTGYTAIPLKSEDGHAPTASEHTTLLENRGDASPQSETGIFLKLSEQAIRQRDIPQELRPTLQKLIEGQKRRIKHAQTQGTRGIEALQTCPNCFQQYNSRTLKKHRQSQECTIGHFMYAWMNATLLHKQHLLKFGNLLLVLTVKEYGLKSPQKNKKLQQDSQSQDYMYAIHKKTFSPNR